MPPPNRTTDADYHYHVYDYPGSAAWTPALQGRIPQQQFYSLLKDLEDLAAYGGTLGVPNIALSRPGTAINVDGATFQTLALRFGNNAPTAPVVVLTGGIHA